MAPTSASTVAMMPNRGGASAQDVADLAGELRAGVEDRFGVTLEPEPTLVGLTL